MKRILQAGVRYSRPLFRKLQMLPPLLLIRRKKSRTFPIFLSTTKNNDGKLLSESLNDAILALRENLQVDSVSLLQSSSPNSILAGYVHGRASRTATCGTFASIVEVEVTSDKGKDEAHEAAKKLAMHVVAAKPLYLNPDSVPEDLVQKEKGVLMEKVCWVLIHFVLI